MTFPSSGPTLPSVVYIPAVVEIDNRALSKALGGQSRAVLSLWRKRYGMPRPLYREGILSFTETALIAAWLNGRGHRVVFL